MNNENFIIDCLEIHSKQLVIATLQLLKEKNYLNQNGIDFYNRIFNEMNKRGD